MSTRFARVRPSSIGTAFIPAALGLALLLFPLSTRAAAQDDPDFWANDTATTDWSDRVPAYLAVVDGTAWLDRDGTSEEAAENVPLIAGDLLETEAGRVEVLFSDGSSLALDQDSAVEFLSDSLVRLIRGRVAFSVARGGASAQYRIDAAGTTTWLRAAGDYRLDVMEGSAGRVDVTVIRGSAELATEFGRTLVGAGSAARASATTAPSRPYAANVALYSTIDRWVDRQRFDRVGSRTATYLPTELRTYSGVFDRYGAWEYESSYGYVWYPRVDVTWRPYAYGRWSVVGRYGWTWIGEDRWSWTTHHYGRWGLAGSRWYWIPDRRWAPAWVSWASSPGFVGWCPLGYDNRPLISVSLGYNAGWRAWSVAPARSFQAGRVIASRQIVRPADVGGRFVERRSSPSAATVFRGGASNSRVGTRTPIETGRVAVPREGAIGIRAPRAGVEQAPGRVPRGTGSGATIESTEPAAPPSRAPRATIEPRRSGVVAPPSSLPSTRDTASPRERTLRVPRPSTPEPRPTEPERLEPPSSSSRQRATRPSPEPVERPETVERAPRVLPREPAERVGRPGAAAPGRAPRSETPRAEPVRPREAPNAPAAGPVPQERPAAPSAGEGNGSTRGRAQPRQR